MTSRVSVRIFQRSSRTSRLCARSARRCSDWGLSSPVTWSIEVPQHPGRRHGAREPLRGLVPGYLRKARGLGRAGQFKSACPEKVSNATSTNGLLASRILRRWRGRSLLTPYHVPFRVIQNSLIQSVQPRRPQSVSPNRHVTRYAFAPIALLQLAGRWDSQRP